MKIIVPTRDDNVDPHFLHCAHYTVFTTNANNAIEGSEVIPSMQNNEGGRQAVADALNKLGINTVLAKNMNETMVELLKAHSISVFRGCSGKVDDIVKQYLKGGIKDNANCGIEHKHHGSCSAAGKQDTHEDNRHCR